MSINKKIRYFFCKEKWILIVILIISIASTALTLSLHESKPKTTNFIIQNFTKIDNSNFSKIAETLEKTFLTYWSNCRGFDEYRENVEIKCETSYGIQSMATESFETFFLLGKKNIIQCLDSFLKNEINCSNFGWVNRHEYWSRFIGSFIGAFTLTKDASFLNMALKCADHALDIEEKSMEVSSLINLKENKTKNYPFTKYTITADIGVSLPELLALYNLTNNKRYYNRATKLLSYLPSQFTAPIHPYWSTRKKEPGTKLNWFDYKTIGLIESLYLANEIRPNKYIREFLKESFAEIPAKNDMIYYPILEIYQNLRLKFDIPKPIGFDDATIKIFEDKIPITNPVYNYTGRKPFQTSCFAYEANYLRFIQKHVESLAINIAENTSLYFKNHVQCVGISGSVYSSDIISSNVISQWLKQPLIWKSPYKYIQNDRGHLLLQI